MTGAEASPLSAAGGEHCGNRNTGKEKENLMIQLTTLKGSLFYLNPELIEQVEETHDTIITLTGGKKIRVSQSAGEVVEKVMAYRKAIHRMDWREWE